MLQLLSPSLKLQSKDDATASTTTTDSSAAPSVSAMNNSQKRIYLMLSKYISTIRGDDYVDRLNQVLHKFSVSASSSNIQRYYAERPELKDYTLRVELDRDLDYTLILRDGTPLTDKEDIRSYFNNEGTQSISYPDSVSTEELLIRAANQSLLADALGTLTGSEEILFPSLFFPKHTDEIDRKHQPALILPGHILSMTSVVEKIHFTIDLPRGRVEAICVLAVVVPDEDRRLALARAILVASFQPGVKKRKRLQYELKYVKSHHSTSSNAIRVAAVSIANDQENLKDQNKPPSFFESLPSRIPSSGSESSSATSMKSDQDNNMKKLFNGIFNNK